MPRAVRLAACVSPLGLALIGCATSPVQTATSYASAGANVTYHAAANGVHAVYATGGDVYSGVGSAAKQPFHDLNMMQDQIPPVLIRAEAKPYDVAGLDSCDAILNKVAQLDLALGPDLDSPKDRKKDRTARNATLAAAAAIEAASSAAEGFLPMRSVIKEVSGASRYEAHVKHAVLAGTERRAFLKAVGMEHNCSWPAAPLGFQPVIVAVATVPLAVPPLPPSPALASPVLNARLYPSGGVIATQAPVQARSPGLAASGRSGARQIASLTPVAAPVRARRPPAPASIAAALGPVAAATPTPAAILAAPSADAALAPDLRSATLVGAAATSPSAAFASPWSGPAPAR